MKAKRVISLMIALAMTMSLAACGEKKKEEAVTPAKLTAPGTFPIVEEKVTISALAPVSAPNNDLSYEANEFTKWYEDKTNVHIDWNVSNNEDMQTKLSILMASNELPDLLFGTNFSPEQLQLFGSQKQLYPLNDLIKEQGHYINALFEFFPDVINDMTSADGNIYGLPQMFYSGHSEVPFRMYIYQPWLDKLGIKMPETTEEFYQVLKAFKTQDPNGNGIADEIALAGSEKGWNTDFWIFLMNSFIYTSPSSYYAYLKDGKATLIWDQDEYRKGLEYLHKLYSEGLIAEESFSQDGSQLVAMGSKVDTNILGAAAGGYQASFTTIEEGKEGRWTEFKAVNPLEGPDGTRYAASSPTIPYFKVSIGGNAKYPEVAFRVAEAMYKYDIGTSAQIGLEGKFWECYEVDPNRPTIDGGPAPKMERRNLKPLYGEKEAVNYAWSGGMVGTTEPDKTSPLYENRNASILIPENADTNLEFMLSQIAEEYKKYSPDIDVPLLVLTLEESKESADITSTLSTFTTSSRTKFIMEGITDESWNSYVKTLKDMGIEKLNKIYQDAYGRRKK